MQSWTLNFLRLALPLTLLIFGGCATKPIPLPEATESEFFRTGQSGFHIEARGGIIRYVVLLERKFVFEKPLHLTVSYQNPADETDPHIEELVWPADEEWLELASPPLRGLEPNVFYLISIEIFEEADRTEAVDTHEVFIFSTIDTRSYGR